MATPDEPLEALRADIGRMLSGKGKRTPDHFHKELGRIMWEHCGMARTKAGPPPTPSGGSGLPQRGESSGRSNRSQQVNRHRSERVHRSGRKR